MIRVRRRGSARPAQTLPSRDQALEPFRGSIQQVVDDIHEAERIGVEHLIFECPVQYGDERFDTIEAFAADILPQFRASPQLTS